MRLRFSKDVYLLHRFLSISVDVISLVLSTVVSVVSSALDRLVRSQIGCKPT